MAPVVDSVVLLVPKLLLVAIVVTAAPDPKYKEAILVKALPEVITSWVPIFKPPELILKLPDTSTSAPPVL